jgi:periplasmic glucans biosynthesis protein
MCRPQTGAVFCSPRLLMTHALCPCLLLSLGTALALASAPAAAFGFDDVDRLARERAAATYQAPTQKLPPALAELSRERYEAIRHRADRALWHDTRLPFQLSFLHPGMGYSQPVRIHVVASSGLREIRFDPDDFDYGGSGVDPASVKGLAFSGLRVHYPLAGGGSRDPVLEFHGASFFRAYGRDQVRGMLARGVAVDTGELSGEEFPSFTDLWIEWPRAQDHALTIHALLDGPRMTGAYRFRVMPGDETEVDVRVRLHLRADVAKLGLAPLTSMYFYGENQPRAADDYRPEVHNSDGLSIHAGDEWIWRPLVNPRRLFITAFGVNALHGFGLMQRDRAFASYQDLDARYERRPGVWVEPRSEWGRGRVELVAIPTPDETNDNIVAYWVPEHAPRAGDTLDLRYRLRWQGDAQTLPPLAYVTQTRVDHGRDGDSDEGMLRFHIDFAGAALDALPPDTAPVAGLWVGDGSELIANDLRRNPAAGGWRLYLQVRRHEPTRPLELRAVLRDGERAVSESWAYALPAIAGR